MHLQPAKCLRPTVDMQHARLPHARHTSHLPRGTHAVNTERLVLGSSGMVHNEGGWPKEIDPREKGETSRFRKKVRCETVAHVWFACRIRGCGNFTLRAAG